MYMHTDLACEIAGRAGGAGVSVEEKTQGGMTVTIVKVLNEKGAGKIGKPVGTYVTAHSPSLCKNEPLLKRDMAQTIAQQLQTLLPQIKKDDTVLVLGLGNSAVTPDALGSKTAQRVLVTRHIMQNIPDAVDDRARCVCAIAPGVLGVTGLETGEVALGIVENIRPACVIAVDSLAALSLHRVLTTVQLSDSGICPGSGLNNPRRELTHKTLGVPVIAVGVPLVVSARSILNDALGAQDDDDELAQALAAHMDDMVVTPKDIDEAVNLAADVVAMGINLAIHDGISYDEFTQL